jgi:hypothetical protein
VWTIDWTEKLEKLQIPVPAQIAPDHQPGQAI